ncbi:PD-(D/E)XK motif protein [Ferrovum myxofaciens]|uniref:PD-(D/E)XK motif protein n=1 Tax=Ferrovum myxofaciens TaxID=416213 RepID=UPI00068C71BB|nr:PD-(D/E)XK motif protein [Ferrovum myxofaciens]
MTAPNDPWKDLTPPSAASAINARRVDENNPWGFFWARAMDGKCLLVLQHKTESSPAKKLPSLKGVEVAVTEGYSQHNLMLVFRLLDSRQRDIFHQLCIDIVAAGAPACTESEAVALAVARTWRWHHLLRGGTGGRLSEDEQKGLIGELLVLERHLLPCLSPADCLAAWRGPLGAPKDFEVGRICIEAKARRGAATPFVLITSEHQLDGEGCDFLFLHVADLSHAPEGADQTFTVSDAARRVHDRLSLDNAAADKYESLLAAAGFRWEDDYSDFKWMEGPCRIYGVSDGFPRVTANEIATGVSNVRYSVSLIECERFVVEARTMNEAITGYAP